MSSTTDILLKKASRLTRRALVYLYWEQYSPVFARAAILLSLFLIGSFAGLWQWIGDPFRLIILIAAIVYLVLSFIKASKLARPSQSAARRRVEEDSNVKHRPLDTLHDRPALSDKGWNAHYDKAKTAVQNLMPPRLRPVLAGIDKYYLRFTLPIALVLSLMIGTGDSFERLRHALSPGWISGAMNDDITFEAWVDPPAYTGRPPIYFKNTNKVEIPVGSELVARVIGTKDPTRLKLKGPRGSRHLALTRIGPDSFEARAIVKDSSTASWRIGESRKEWKITALKDRPPVVNFVREPDADKRDRISFSFSIDDDYGVDELSLVMSLLQDDETAPNQVRVVPVPIGGSIRKTDEENAALDLTKHEWAGKKVSAVLSVRDGLRQHARSDVVYFTVPDKIFVEPLAKAIVEQRSLVMAGQAEYEQLPRLTRKEWRNQPWFDTWQPEFRLERAPESVQQAAILIDAVTDHPSGLFQDPAIYMGLRNVSSRLHYARDNAELEGIPDDLWNIALRAEFGTLGSALEEMQEAEAALRDGMARRAPQREIDTLFERYNEAVDRYREELLRKAIEEGSSADSGGGGEGGGVNMDEIQALLDAIEEANRQGDSEGARRALAQLAELLENLQIQLASGGGGSGGQQMPGEMSEEMKEALEDLADLLGEQRELRDDTQQAQRDQEQEGSEGQEGQDQGSEGQQGQEEGSEGQAGSQPNGNQSGSGSDGSSLNPKDLADVQERLQELLGNAQNALPEVGEGDEQRKGSGTTADEEGEDGAGIDPGEALENARRAMRRAEEALREGNMGTAQDEQGEAIAALREAGRGLAEQARNQQGENGQEAGNGQDDPLGRNENGTNDEQSEADLDQRDNAARSRELQDEIRRRAAEQEREQQERDYLERLLKRF